MWSPLQTGMTEKEPQIAPLRRQPFTVHDEFPNRLFHGGVWRPNSQHIVHHLANGAVVVNFLTKIQLTVRGDGVRRIGTQNELPGCHKVVTGNIGPVRVYSGLLVPTQVADSDGSV